MDIAKLAQKLVDGAEVLYIGKHEASVKNRMIQHIAFGEGDPIDAWGGRSIAQIENYEGLEVRYSPNNTAKETESALIEEYVRRNQKLLFANCRR